MYYQSDRIKLGKDCKDLNIFARLLHQSLLNQSQKDKTQHPQMSGFWSNIYIGPQTRILISLLAQKDIQGKDRNKRIQFIDSHLQSVLQSMDFLKFVIDSFCLWKKAIHLTNHKCSFGVLPRSVKISRAQEKVEPCSEINQHTLSPQLPVSLCYAYPMKDNESSQNVLFWLTLGKSGFMYRRTILAEYWSIF